MVDKKESIRDWWADAPMTYAEEHGTVEYHLPDGGTEVVAIGSVKFFELADAVFYRWNEPLHVGKQKFRRIFDYPAFEGREVLEVGCGMGCMASNWARRGAQVTAVDLNPVSVAQTKRRFAEFGLEGDIREADGERLPFEDNRFSFVYSWGVLHHTPGTKEAIQELWRVLEPGGKIGLMLYNRNSFLSKYSIELQEGFVNRERKYLSPLELHSRYGDGARQEGNPHTWPVTKSEVRNHLMADFQDVKIDVFGTDVIEILKGWHPLFEKLPDALLQALAKRWGWSLWITGTKPT